MTTTTKPTDCDHTYPVARQQTSPSWAAFGHGTLEKCLYNPKKVTTSHSHSGLTLTVTSVKGKTHWQLKLSRSENLRLLKNVTILFFWSYATQHFHYDFLSFFYHSGASSTLKLLLTLRWRHHRKCTDFYSSVKLASVRRCTDTDARLNDVVLLSDLCLRQAKFLRQITRWILSDWLLSTTRRCFFNPPAGFWTQTHETQIRYVKLWA